MIYKKRILCQNVVAPKRKYTNIEMYQNCFRAKWNSVNKEFPTRIYSTLFLFTLQHCRFGGIGSAFGLFIAKSPF